MKSFFSLLSLLLLINSLHAQINTNRFLISGKLSGGMIQKDFYTTYGLSAEYLIKNKFGLVYNLDAISSNKTFSLHNTMGITGGALLIYDGFLSITDNDPKTTPDFGLIGGIICLIIPDGISYHQPIGYRWDISPYANLLGVDFVYNSSKQFENIRYACSFGTKFSYLFKDNLFYAFYVETRKSGIQPWSLGIGAGLGFTIKHKEESVQNKTEKKTN